MCYIKLAKFNIAADTIFESTKTFFNQFQGNEKEPIDFEVSCSLDEILTSKANFSEDTDYGKAEAFALLKEMADQFSNAKAAVVNGTFLKMDDKGIAIFGDDPTDRRNVYDVLSNYYYEACELLSSAKGIFRVKGSTLYIHGSPFNIGRDKGKNDSARLSHVFFLSKETRTPRKITSNHTLKEMLRYIYIPQSINGFDTGLYLINKLTHQCECLELPSKVTMTTWMDALKFVHLD